MRVLSRLRRLEKKLFPVFVEQDSQSSTTDIVIQFLTRSVYPLPPPLQPTSGVLRPFSVPTPKDSLETTDATVKAAQAI
jgi:hypothetical protein